MLVSRKDYIMKMINKIAEILRKTLGKEKIDKEFLKKVVRETCGFDLEMVSSSPLLAKQMIELSSANDENKKALATVCLYLSNKGKFEAICREIIKDIKWKIINDESKKLLTETFNISIK